MRCAPGRRRWLLGFVLVGATFAAGCVHFITTDRPQPLGAGTAAGVANGVIRAPLEAHLADGGTIVFRDGAVIADGRITGRGEAYSVGFVATTQGDDPAAGAPGWPDAWHEHSGLLSDESGPRPCARDHR